MADRRKYETSATEQEVQRGALRSIQDHVFCYLRTIDLAAGLPHDQRVGDFVDLSPGGGWDETARTRLARLRAELRRLPEANVHEYAVRWTGEVPTPITTDHLDRLCEQVHADLLRIITEEIRRTEDVDRVQKEIDAHAAFGAERARFFVGRSDVLGWIASYVDRPDHHPRLVFGAGGSGKSSVMARAAQEAAERSPDGVVVRFVGATPDSSNSRALLDGLCREISRRYGGDEATIPSDYQELVRDFPDRLALATESRPLILFVDALDQLSNAAEASSLSWLPAELPPHVCLIVSTLAGTSSRALDGRVPESGRVELQPMAGGEAATLLDAWLQEAGRALRPAQRDAVLRQFAVEGLPLWLKLAFEEARRWKSSHSDAELPPTISEIITDELFDRLDDEANHGHVVVAHGLGYLAAARNGLSEDEVLDVLSLAGSGGAVLRDFRRRSPKSPEVERLPPILWSRLHADLEPYLTERSADGTTLMTFYHRQLAEAVAERYLVGDHGLARHRELASYFGGQGLEVGSGDRTTPNLRAMSELPYQQTHGELWDEVVATLTDFDFLEKKATHAGVVQSTDSQGRAVSTYTGIYQLRDDYALALARMRRAEGVTDRTDARRCIVVTGVDFGAGLVIRCPHCNLEHPFRDTWRGQEIECPNPECKGPLRVNPFVVEGR